MFYINLDVCVRHLRFETLLGLGGRSWSWVNGMLSARDISIRIDGSAPRDETDCRDSIPRDWRLS